jgi:hypothetical protein
MLLKTGGECRNLMGGELRDILYIEIDSIRFCTPEMLEKFNDLCFN